MNKITSHDISQAIEFASSNSGIREQLEIRNDDKNLDCRYIRCEVISGIDAKVKRFKIIFNYDFISGKTTWGEDIEVIVEYVEGNFSIIDWRKK